MGIPEVKIAVIDTYFDTTNIDFVGQYDMVRGNTYSYPGNTAYAIQRRNHGTGVASIIGAKSDNNTGMAGIAPNCRLILSTHTQNSGELEFLSQQNGVRVMNASWGWCSYTQTDSMAAVAVRENGAILVSGAGNSHCGGSSSYLYPASYDSVISVTSVGHIYSRGSSEPNWKDVHIYDPSATASSSHQHNDRVDICAPGYSIPSLDVDGVFRYNFGTSFGSPIIAGICGLIISANVCLTPDEVENILKSTAANIDTIPENAPYAGLLGAGRVDAYAAVLKASKMGTNKLENRTISTTEEHTASYGVQLGNNLTIANGGDLIAKSKHTIEIKENFVVQAGATFEMFVNNDIPISCP